MRISRETYPVIALLVAPEATAKLSAGGNVFE